MALCDSVSEKPSCLLLPPQNTSRVGGREGKDQIEPIRTDLVQVPSGAHGGQERSLPRRRALTGGTKELTYSSYRDFTSYL